MFEILSLVGAPGLGKITQIASDFLSDRRREKSDNAEREFRKSLADKKQLLDYMGAIHGTDDDYLPTLHSVVMDSLYIMFAGITCAFIATCLYIQWELGNDAFMVGIKDPEQAANTYSLLGGAIEWSRVTNKITFISPLGVAYLALHPLLFVLGLVSSGRSPFKGTR